LSFSQYTFIEEPSRTFMGLQNFYWKLEGLEVDLKTLIFTSKAPLY